MKAHRHSYAIHRGPIPDGLHVLHKCDNRLCVNPEHLFLGTNHDNILDCVSKGRRRDVRGEKNGRNKLSADQVREIRELYASGSVTQEELAKRYGFSKQSGISSIITRRTWAHV